MLPTFPSRYWFTIGLLRVFSLAGWSPRIQTGFHVSRPTQVALLDHALCLYRTVTVSGQTFQIVPIRNMVSLERSYNPTDAVTTVVWALSLSIATTREIDLFFLFLRVLRCFSSPGWPHITMVHGLHPCGLTHSDIPGSKPVCGSPGLFAAYHVLRRLQKPRHPPFALNNLQCLILARKAKIECSLSESKLHILYAV